MPMKSLLLAERDQMMMTVTPSPGGSGAGDPCIGRKRPRIVAPRAYGFHTFGDPGYPADYGGPFRDNVRSFLNECAEREVFNVEGRPAWSVALDFDIGYGSGGNGTPRILSLVVVEESVQNSPHPHCDNCRCIGWGHHMVSNRRYHFIIPAPEIGERPLGSMSNVIVSKVCPNCHDPVPASAFACPTCAEEAVRGSILDLQTHLLHGVLHCNGFGHLLCLNGKEHGSKHASGREIMDLWDRLCAMLRARTVSVEDLAKKRSLELRLLHCVAYGESWYGRWGYKFGHGSYGITQQMYAKAIEAIRGMPLNVLQKHFEEVDQQVISIVARYQWVSGESLQTLGNLVRFMIELKARLPLCNNPISGIKRANTAATTATTTGTTNSTITNDSKQFDSSRAERKSSSTTSSTSSGSNNINQLEAPCRWSAKRLELATQVIVEALRSCEKKWMPRQDVRDAARTYIGDTGLLDFVLKSLGNRVVGDFTVRRAVNPITKVLEYSLEEMNTTTNTIANTNTSTGSIRATTTTTTTTTMSKAVEKSCGNIIGRAEVLRDIAYIYKHVLETYKPAMCAGKTAITAIPTASRIVLDIKHFMKDYNGTITRRCAASEWDMTEDDEMLRFMCTIDMLLPGEESGVGPRGLPRHPAELVVLPPHATLGDLKSAAQLAFQDTYFMMHSFRVESISSLGCHDDDDELLFGNIESGSEVALVMGGGGGISDAMGSEQLCFEGGSDSWVVDCQCGTHDDDGERMIACDMCEVWQHTRCAGISDLDSIPLRFLCTPCSLGLFHAMI